MIFGRLKVDLSCMLWLFSTKPSENKSSRDQVSAICFMSVGVYHHWPLVRIWICTHFIMQKKKKKDPLKIRRQQECKYWDVDQFMWQWRRFL